MTARPLRRMAVSVFVLGLALGLSAPAALARQDPASPAAAQAAAPVAVPPLGFSERVLPNGLRVFTAPDAATSNVTVQVWYRVGGKDDPEGRSGFAHLFEHLMFKATRNLPPETFDRLTEDVGGTNNASTSADFTNYFETVPAHHLERMLFAEAERMGSLVVDEAVFASERDVVKEEFRQRVLATPYGRFQALHAPAFIHQTSPYRRPVIGSIADLDAASIDDVLRFHATYYRPDNAYLIVAGNFDPARLDRWIDRYFGPIANPDRPLPANAVAETFGGPGPREAVFHGPNVPLPMVSIVWPTAPYDHADRAALEVLDGVLSTGASSRLYRALVYEQQVAASAGSGASHQQQVGTLQTIAVVTQDRTPAEALAALRAEIARLRETPVTAAELAEAKNELVASTLRARETAEGRAFALGYALVMTGDPASADRDLPALQAVTAEDVRRVARLYLTDDRAIAMTYLQADEADPETPAREEFSAPVTLADLAPAGEPVTLAPEGRRVPLPEPGQPLSAVTPQVAERRLANGLRVLVAPTRRAPLVSARLGFPVGAASDPQGQGGLAAFTAGLLSEGSAGLSAPEFASRVESLGADIGAGAGPDFTTAYVNAPTNVFPQALALMAGMVRQPAFAAEELSRQQLQALSGFRVQLSQPGPVAGLAAARAVYGDAPYGAPSSGTPSTIPALTRDDLAAFHARRYRPGEATLVFSGDIDLETAVALAEQAFGDWRDPPSVPPAALPGAGQPRPPRVIVIDQPGAGQAAVVAAMRGISRDDPDYLALTLGNAVMGGGFSARLNQEIRIRRGLSYGAGSSLGARRDAGALTASAQTRNDAVVQVAGLILAEIARLSDEEPTADELAPRKATLIGGFGRSLETVDGLGAWVANLALYGLPLEQLATYADDVNGVTPQAVRAAAARRLPADQASLVVVGDASVFLEGLRAAYPSVEVIPLSEIDLDSPDFR